MLICLLTDFKIITPFLTRFELTCGSSRLWGGVHFVDAVEEGNRIGNEIGKIATEFVRRHINPKNPPQGPVVGPLARGPKSQPLRAAPTRAAPAAAPTGMVANDFLCILGSDPSLPFLMEKILSDGL